MVQGTLPEERTYPCEPARLDYLDGMVRKIYYGHEKNRDTHNLRRFLHKEASKNIPWKSLRHLRIVGDDDKKHLEYFEAMDIPRGFYLNADGTWLLLILPEKPDLSNYLGRCGETAESLEIWNSMMYSRDVGKLPGLKVLHLEDNSLLESVDRLDLLTELTQLWIVNCRRLTALPGLDKLTNLAELKVADCNNLAVLPSLENLTHLTSLQFSNCEQLTELPGLEKLTRLRELTLSWCSGFTALPGLENLTRLTSLDLSECDNITALPGLENLTRLTKLDLAYCKKLTSLPGLENLTELTELNLEFCAGLTTLPGLEKLAHLTALNLLFCQNLTSLPGLENLTRLTELTLASCTSLRTLPEGIRKLKRLRFLNLSMMKLKELPDWLPEIAEKFETDTVISFGSTKAAVWLNETTVEDIRDMSIFDQPYEMVVEWFEKRKQGKVQQLNEIKVVFLGDGEAGKSHTIARLMNDGDEPDEKTYNGQSTPGIVIRNKEYNLNGRRIQIHYWDFGGQEILHSMHRIFLTNRTMYVILLNARDDTQSDRARYWLHNVKSFAPDAPVLLVLNKIDQNPNASVNETDLRSRYDKLTRVVRLSAKDYSREDFNREFTQVLLQEIQNTGFLDARWPVSWTKVKGKLEKMSSHYILGDEYQQICETCGVDDNQRNLLHWFNDLGVSFCFCGEDDYTLKNHVILRPDWITNALYIILFNECAGVKNGLFPHRSVYDLLERASFDPSIRCTLPTAKYNKPGDVQYVLGVMQKFSLSFTDGMHNEFIPMLCQQNSTVDIQYYHKDPDILEFNMDFDYLPNNLLHRLMVERHQELDMENVWRTGAGFQLPELKLSALVVIDGNILRIFIRHRDDMHRPNTYLTMLKANVDRIWRSMGLKEPTCQVVYKLDGKQDLFDYALLKAMLEAGQTQVFSMTWKKMLPIADILNQAAPDGLEDERNLLDRILISCRNIQGEPDYRVSPDAERNKGLEDKRNRRVRDNLENWGYIAKDQPQYGVSGTGKSIGELDILVYDEQRRPWTVIEALRISGYATSDWNDHLDKLLYNYNYFGARSLYLLTYVDCKRQDFGGIWTAFKAHIQGHDSTQFAYEPGSFVDLNDPKDPILVKKSKCRYNCGGQMTTVYHIFVQIGLPPALHRQQALLVA